MDVLCELYAIEILNGYCCTYSLEHKSLLYYFLEFSHYNLFLETERGNEALNTEKDQNLNVILLNCLSLF